MKKYSNYIILKNSGGEYKPYLFSNGSLVIFGDKQEAIDDLNEGEIVVELLFN